MAKDTINLTVNQFINLYQNIEKGKKRNNLNEMTISELITKIINDKTNMMFDSWCNNIDVIN